MKITAISISLLLFVVTQVRSEFKHHENETPQGTHTLTYYCKPNEKLNFANYDGDSEGRVLDLSSLNISSCDSVDLPEFTVPFLERSLKKIKIENIRNTTSFRPRLLSQELDSIELRNIGYIPDMLTEYMFHSVRKMNYLAIEKTTIGTFKQIFFKTTLKTVIFRDVCIQNLVGLAGLSTELGGRLEIINCCIVITESPVHIEEFDHIKIADSTFEFDEKGEISIVGNHVVLSNNNIVNASISVKGNNTIEVTNTCGTGSTMRLDSEDTKSHGNRLAGEIIYAQTRKDESDNHECSSGNCGCHTHSACRRKHDPFIDFPKPNVVAHNAGKTVHLDKVFFLSLPTSLAYFLVVTSFK